MIQIYIWIHVFEWINLRIYDYEWFVCAFMIQIFLYLKSCMISWSKFIYEYYMISYSWKISRNHAIIMAEFIQWVQVHISIYGWTLQSEIWICYSKFNAEINTEFSHELLSKEVCWTRSLGYRDRWLTFLSSSGKGQLQMFQLQLFHTRTQVYVLMIWYLWAWGRPSDWASCPGQHRWSLLSCKNQQPLSFFSCSGSIKKYSLDTTRQGNLCTWVCCKQLDTMHCWVQNRISRFGPTTQTTQLK